MLAKDHQAKILAAAGIGWQPKNLEKWVRTIPTARDTDGVARTWRLGAPEIKGARVVGRRTEIVLFRADRHRGRLDGRRPDLLAGTGWRGGWKRNEGSTNASIEE